MTKEVEPRGEPGPRTTSTPGWAIGLVGAALGLCYLQYLGWMVERWWRDEYYGHGFLIPLISGYIVYRHWDQLRAAPRRDFGVGLPLMAVGILLHLGATYYDVRFPSGFAFILTLYGVIIWMWGWPVARAVAFPVFFLVFMVPMARLLVDVFAQPLQLLGAKLGGGFSQAIGIPTKIEGTTVHIPEYTFEVAVACSGLKSVIAMSALGTLYAYMVQAALWKRLVIVISSLPVALWANASRIAVTLVLGRVFGQRAAEGFFHTASGLLVFLLALIGLFIVGSVLGCNRIRDDI